MSKLKVHYGYQIGIGENGEDPDGACAYGQEYFEGWTNNWEHVTCKKCLKKQIVRG